MVFFISVGVLALAFGVMMIFAPDTLRRLNEASMTVIKDLDSAAFSHKNGVGLFLIISSLLFFFVAYYINARG